MKKLLILLLFITCHVRATDLTITNAIFGGNPRDSKNPTLTAWITISWKNAWRNDKNYDAAWIFFKVNTGDENRAKLHGFIRKDISLVHNYVNNTINPLFFVPEDGAGFMIFPDKKYRGDVSWRIKLELDMSKITGLSSEGLVHAFPYGIEMVYIPQGAFYAGEADTLTQHREGAFFEYGTNDFYKINSEAAINVGTTKGDLYYNNDNQPDYRGDMKGPVPAAFPKGFNAFYVMKYEVTQGDYVSFLNAVGDFFSRNRAPFGGKMYYKDRGSIFFEDGLYKTNEPNRPATFLSWDDDCAFADWSGLRPMTELEYEKACRGPQKPAVSNGFPWGTNSKEKLSRYYDNNGDLVLQPPLKEKDINDTNLDLFGASYYWVMDLNTSLWERCVTTGNAKGRSFEGTHGDGRLQGYSGNATNVDWPRWDGNGGISYRGGGYYMIGMVGSPLGFVSQRRFAAWGDGPRDIAYGFRAARSAY